MPRERLKHAQDPTVPATFILHEEMIHIESIVTILDIIKFYFVIFYV